MCERVRTEKEEVAVTNVIIGFATLVIIFILVIVLGVQIQISSLSQRIDEILDRLPRP